MAERVLVAKTERQAHANGASGDWWAEYAVRPLTEQEVSEVWQRIGKVYRYVLESRYCHEMDSEYCKHHSGQWEHWDYGQTEQDAVFSCSGDTLYQGAESLSPLHGQMKAQTAKDRTRNARIAELREQLYHTWFAYGEYHTEEIDIERDERERAEAEFERECKTARIWSKVLADSAPADKLTAIKTRVIATYQERLKARKQERDLALKELEELQSV